MLVGDDTSSLQVSNLTSESAEALEEKSFFYGKKYINLEQLMDVVKPCACVSLATITSIEYEEGWVCIACCECNCKAVLKDDESSCKKDFARVNDDLACASFLMFDRDVFSIVDRSAYVLNEKQANKPNTTDYPDDLNKLIGKTLLFRVDVSRYNLINNYVIYTVGRMTSSELHIKSFIKLYVDEMHDVESSIAENVVKFEPIKVNAMPSQGKHGIADVDKYKGALSVTSRNKKKVVFLCRDK
ncbi:replication protein A 70 kDa DNA-binding subunit B-like protein [Tanacetum coccineum]